MLTNANARKGAAAGGSRGRQAARSFTEDAMHLDLWHCTRRHNSLTHMRVDTLTLTHTSSARARAVRKSIIIKPYFDNGNKNMARRRRALAHTHIHYCIAVIIASWTVAHTQQRSAQANRARATTTAAAYILSLLVAGANACGHIYYVRERRGVPPPPPPCD